VLAQQFGVLDLSYGDEAAAAADILWEVRNADGKAVWSTTVAAPLVPLAAGEYSIHALRLGKDQSVDVRIVAGDRKVVAIRPE